MSTHDERVLQRRLERVTKERDQYLELLSSISYELSGVSWSPDTIQQIAQMMLAGGFKIREPR